MTILNVNINTVGQSGQVPKLIYIETNNTESEVIATGFMDALVQQGLPISTADIAVVSTKTTPHAGLYNIEYSSGHYTLVSIGGGSSGAAWQLGGNTVSGPQIFGTLTDDPISFVANNFEYMAFDTASSVLNISADNMAVEASNLVSLEGDTITLESFTEIAIGNVVTPTVLIGNNSDPANLVSIDSPIVTLTNIPSATKANVVYYDAVTKQTSYGAQTPVFDPSSNQTITGDWSFTGDFGVNLTGNNLNLATTTTINIESGGDLNLTSDNDLFITADDDVEIDAPTSIGIGTSSPVVVIGNNSSSTNSTTIASQVVKLTNIPSATKANVVYYDPATDALSEGVAPVSFNTASNYSTSGNWANFGDWQWSAGFLVSNSTSVAFTTSGIFQVHAGSMDLEATGTTAIGTTNSTAISIGNTNLGTNSISLLSPVVSLSNIPAATTANVVYIDPTTKQLSEGLSPTSSGIPAWSSTTTYSIGSLVVNSVGIIYTSITNSNTNNAITDSSNWLPNLQYGMTTPMTLPYSVTIPANYTMTWPMLTIPNSTTLTVTSNGAFVGLVDVIVNATGIMQVNGTSVII